LAVGSFHSATRRPDRYRHQQAITSHDTRGITVDAGRDLHGLTVSIDALGIATAIRVDGA
jgi:hypothetical protein